MQRIVIVGAGLVGATLAWRLSLAGCQVTVVEASGAASGASGRSFGWINASFYLSAAHFRLRVAGIEAHHRLEAEVGSGLWQWPGCLWWETGLEAQAAALAGLGYQVQEVSGAAVAALEPGLAQSPERALLFAGEGAVDAAALTRALLVGCGAQVLFGMPVEALVERGGVVRGVRVPGGEIAADQVIVAAGTGAAALLAGVGFGLPMLARPGVILTSRPLGRVISRILATPQGDVRQDATGRIIAPLAGHHQADVTETAPADVPERVAGVLQRLQDLLGVQVEPEAVALAWRPVPGDGLPAVGTVVPGLSLAVMHSGVTLAPVVAEALATQVMGGEASPLLTEFGPGRFWT